MSSVNGYECRDCAKYQYGMDIVKRAARAALDKGMSDRHTRSTDIIYCDRSECFYVSGASPACEDITITRTNGQHIAR